MLFCSFSLQPGHFPLFNQSLDLEKGVKIHIDVLSLFNSYAPQLAGAAEGQYSCRVCANHWTKSRRLTYSGPLSHFECHMKSQIVDEFSTKAVCYCHGDPCVPGSICHYMAWIVSVSGNSKMRLSRWETDLIRTGHKGR